MTVEITNILVLKMTSSCCIKCFLQWEVYFTVESVFYYGIERQQNKLFAEIRHVCITRSTM